MVSTELLSKGIRHSLAPTGAIASSAHPAEARQHGDRTHDLGLGDRVPGPRLIPQPAVHPTTLTEHGLIHV